MFVIQSFSFESLSSESRTRLLPLMGVHGEHVREFFSLYFDRFYLLHKMGHLVLEMFDPDQQKYPARTESLANLFALKYLEKKAETGYLDLLKQKIELFLTTHRAHFDFEIPTMDRLFPRYRLDLLTYAAFHFNSFRRCLHDTRSFEEVLAQMSGGRLNAVSTFTLLKKGTSGQQLVNECAQTIFELNGDVPSIEVRFGGDLHAEALDRQPRQAAAAF